MRIAFVSLETSHHVETETNARLQTITELLTDAGHEVCVLCSQWWDGPETTYERDDVTYHGLSVGPEAGRAFCSRVPHTIGSLGPDVVHAMAEPPTQVIAADVGATLARVPLVCEWYAGNGVHDSRRHRWAGRRADRIVSPSRLVKTWVRELGPSGEDVEVIPNPIDLSAIREIEPGPDRDVIYARRLDDQANLESLLLALAERRDADWTATVVGDGPDRSRYERLVRDLRIEDRVTFLGEISREERIACYRGGHVFAQTAEHCVFPTELCWALACGCVGVVEYHVDSSAHELVEGHERGYRTTSETELSDAVFEARTRDRRDVDPVFESFDRPQVRDRFLELYRECIDDSGLF